MGEERYSDFIVYVDESGDHGLRSIDANYPIFVLAFCVFRKSEYINRLVPAIQLFKFRHFGHDGVILHEHDIRKDKGAFAMLRSRSAKGDFVDELSGIVAEAPFTLITSGIEKQKLRERYDEPGNPYHRALGFCLERLYFFLRNQRQLSATTHIVVEQRGRREDDERELEFRRVCNGDNYITKRFPFELVFADKRANSSGLQLADLVARPVGMSVLRPGQPNRAFAILESKLYASPDGRVDGYGLKIFS